MHMTSWVRRVGASSWITRAQHRYLHISTEGVMTTRNESKCTRGFFSIRLTRLHPKNTMWMPRALHKRQYTYARAHTHTHKMCFSADKPSQVRNEFLMVYKTRNRFYTHNRSSYACEWSRIVPRWIVGGRLVRISCMYVVMCIHPKPSRQNHKTNTNQRLVSLIYIVCRSEGNKASYSPITCTNFWFVVLWQIYERARARTRFF